MDWALKILRTGKYFLCLQENIFLAYRKIFVFVFLNLSFSLCVETMPKHHLCYAQMPAICLPSFFIPHKTEVSWFPKKKSKLFSIKQLAGAVEAVFPSSSLFISLKQPHPLSRMFRTKNRNKVALGKCASVWKEKYNVFPPFL